MDTITLKWTTCCVIIYIRTIRSHVRRNMSKFLPRDAIYSAARTMLSQRACQSVHFSRCGIVSKRLNILSTFVSPPDRPISLWSKPRSKIPTRSPLTEASKYTGCTKNSQFSTSTSLYLGNDDSKAWRYSYNKRLLQIVCESKSIILLFCLQITISGDMYRVAQNKIPHWRILWKLQFFTGIFSVTPE